MRRNRGLLWIAMLACLLIGSAAFGSVPQGSAEPDRIVGHLGIERHPTPIRAGHGPDEHVLATVPAGTYVALTGGFEGWYAVMMSDKSTGWVRKSDVDILNYEVIADVYVAGQTPRSHHATDADNPLLSSDQKTILNTAYQLLGVPYRKGSSSLKGLDDAAFVQRCFAAVGIRLARTARKQMTCGMPVSYGQLQAADRLYFARRDGRITHTGIYIGNGYFIHAFSSNHGVAINNLAEPKYRKMY